MCAAVGVALVLIWPADGFGQVVINEIMPDPKGVHDNGGEWFELYNAGSGAVDLAGWKIKDEEHDSYVIDSARGTTTIAAGGYLVLCANEEEFSKLRFPVSCDYDYDYDSFRLSNSTMKWCSSMRVTPGRTASSTKKSRGAMNPRRRSRSGADSRWRSSLPTSTTAMPTTGA